MIVWSPLIVPTKKCMCLWPYVLTFYPNLRAVMKSAAGHGQSKLQPSMSTVNIQPVEKCSLSTSTEKIALFYWSTSTGCTYISLFFHPENLHMLSSFVSTNTHALPIPKPNPTPPNIATSALHDTTPKARSDNIAMNQTDHQERSLQSNTKIHSWATFSLVIPSKIIGKEKEIWAYRVVLLQTGSLDILSKQLNNNTSCKNERTRASWHITIV